MRTMRGAAEWGALPVAFVDAFGADLADDLGCSLAGALAADFSFSLAIALAAPIFRLRPAFAAWEADDLALLPPFEVMPSGSVSGLRLGWRQYLVLLRERRTSAAAMTQGHL